MTDEHLKIIYAGYRERQLKVKGYATCCSFGEFCEVFDWMVSVNEALDKKRKGRRE